MLPPFRPFEAKTATAIRLNWWGFNKSRYDTPSPLKGKELLRILERAGFRIIRTKGSHIFVRHEDGRVTIVPVHAGETIGPGLLRAILQDAEMTANDLREYS